MRDVIVVGGGPSGSHAARRCAELGLDTLLVDRAHFPRDKPCGGVVGESAFRLLGPGALSQMEVVGEGGDVYYDFELLGRSTHIEHYCRRRTFDAYLLGRAADAGAEIREGVRVTGAAFGDERAIVHTDAGDVSGRAVIAADGVSSAVARSAGLSLMRSDSRYAALRAELPVSPARARELGICDPPRQATHFFSDLFGFAWVVPLRGAVNVGMGASVDKGAGLRARFARFLHDLDLEGGPAKGAQIPYLPPPRVWGNRLLLTGDAGGFVDPWTGCGIEAGLAASDKASLVCRFAADASDFSAELLSLYGAVTRSQVNGIRWRGRWVKFADRLVEPDPRFPFWVQFVVRNLVGLDSAPPELKGLGRRVTAAAPQ